MAKIKATEKQWEKLDSFMHELDALAYKIETAGQEVSVNTKAFYFLSDKELLRLAKECHDIENRIKKFLEKEVAPWV